MMARHRLLFRRYRRDERGAAATEFALVLTLLSIPILNVADFAIYAWDQMQTDNAAQVGAQAAWTACDPSQLPATTSCSGLTSAVTTAAQSSSLGTGVTVTGITENYYCVNTSTNALVTVGTFPGTKPSDCSSVGSSSDRPGDYVQVAVSYSYTPLFSGVSVASLLTSPITRTAWMRLE